MCCAARDVTTNSEGTATAMTDLGQLAADIPWPDSDAEQATRERIPQLAVPAGSLGRLAELAEWLSGAQGASPPAMPQRVRLVVLDSNADLPIDNGGVGPALADLSDVTVRLVPVGADLEFEAAVEFGVQLADAEIDAGADLLLLGHRGDSVRIPAAAVVSLVTGVEPVRMVGQRDGIDDARWIRDVIAVRDTRRRAAAKRTEPADMLAEIGDPMVAAMTAFLLRAAGRATPVLLDALPTTAAALVVRELAPRAIRWWQAAHRSLDPAHRAALDRLRLDPLLDLQADLDGGAAAALAVPLLRGAVRAVAELPIDPARVPAPEFEPAVEEPVPPDAAESAQAPPESG